MMYHGTNRDGICAIIKSRYVGTKYFDGYGVYLSDNPQDAFNHGQYVLVFEQTPNNLETDDVNDGYLHRGKIKIELIQDVLINVEDGRIWKDFIQGEDHWK